MKRRVKAWVIVDERGRIGCVETTRADARWLRAKGERVVRCVIEYDDGKKAKAKAKKRKARK